MKPNYYTRCGNCIFIGNFVTCTQWAKQRIGEGFAKPIPIVSMQHHKAFRFAWEVSPDGVLRPAKLQKIAPKRVGG